MNEQTLKDMSHLVLNDSTYTETEIFLNLVQSSLTYPMLIFSHVEVLSSAFLGYILIRMVKYLMRGH